ncbi:hypothetical protein CNO08_17100 [Lysobacter capsici]|nr:hypothetical protein CNO08_17100 [Lysobacter capsici]
MPLIAAPAFMPARAQRPDKNFQELMSQRMDRRVDDAIGGNTFSTLRISVDYQSGGAAFER